MGGANRYHIVNPADLEAAAQKLAIVSSLTGAIAGMGGVAQLASSGLISPGKAADAKTAALARHEPKPGNR